MNIIDLLIADHEQLRGELVKLRQDLFHPDLKTRVQAFIAAYELHESVEDEILFPEVAKALQRTLSQHLLSSYESAHKKIWEHLQELVTSMNAMRHKDIQASFFRFAAAAESHFDHEERNLFPVIQNAVDKQVLNALGEKAVSRFFRYANS